MNVGDRLRKLRLENNLTLEEVGEKVGVTKQTLYKYENGIISNIPSDRISKLAKFFDVSPAYLMGWDEPEQAVMNDDTKFLLDKLPTMTDAQAKKLRALYEVIENE